MHPIFLNSENRGYSFHTFYDRFIDICEEHKTNGKALVFAFILYDFGNAQIAKVLKDIDYWLSLHTITGKYLSVFSLHYKPKVKYQRKRNLPDDGPIFYHLSSINDFHNPSESSNILIEKYFDRIAVKYPAVMFFQVQDGAVLDYTLVELDEEEIEPAFIELKAYMACAVETLQKIEDENKGNSKEIFELVKGNVKAVRAVKIAKKKVHKVTSVTDLVSTIMGLKGA